MGGKLQQWDKWSRQNSVSAEIREERGIRCSVPRQGTSPAPTPSIPKHFVPRTGVPSPRVPKRGRRGTCSLSRASSGEQPAPLVLALVPGAGLGVAGVALGTAAAAQRRRSPDTTAGPGRDCAPSAAALIHLLCPPPGAGALLAPTESRNRLNWDGKTRPGLSKPVFSSRCPGCAPCTPGTMNTCVTAFSTLPFPFSPVPNSICGVSFHCWPKGGLLLL